MLWTRYGDYRPTLVQCNISDTISCGKRHEGAVFMTQLLNWTDDRVEQLKTLWTEGLSASQIARVLGGVTRNAVIGKVHRLGLAGRAVPARVDRPRLPQAPRLSVRSHVVEPPMVAEDPLVLEDGSHATVLTINDRMCRWPIRSEERRVGKECRSRW